MKNIFIKLSLVLILLFGFKTNSTASHLMGGEITWRCNANGDYIFTLVLYGDCNGSLGLFGPTETINSNSPAGNFLVNKISEVDVSPNCSDPNDAISCNKAINAPAGTYIYGAVRKITYTGTVTNLSGVPPLNGWEFSWSDCCRPSGDQNHNSGSYYLRSKMYPYTPVPGGAALNTSTCYDSSPEFGEIGSPVLCTGYKFTYNHLAVDRELDSIVFSFAEPYQAANSPIAWSTGYTANAPYPDASEHSSNGPVTLDPVSGEMTMEVNNFGSSAGEGSFASCIKIEAWKGCQKVAEVFRDVSISLLTTGCDASNTKPNTVIDTSLYDQIVRNGNIYRTQVYPGDLVSFEMQAQDFQFNSDGSPQTIFFTAGGLQVSSPYSSGTGCLGPGTCAKFTPIAPQTGFDQALSNNMKFEWTPNCNNLAADGSCGGVTSTYYFTLKMTDDACPAPAVSITTLIVDVLAGDPTAPPLTSIFEEGNGDYTVSWNKAEQDSALDFKDYILYASSSFGGTFVPIDTISEIDSLNTTVDSGSGYSCFYLIKRTGECFFPSNESDTLCHINLSMTASPAAPNSEFADLEWNPLHYPLPATSKKFYEIWAKPSLGTWVKIDSVPEAPNTQLYAYRDTVNVCYDSVKYQIRVVDLENGFLSGSNYREELFSDQRNEDVISIDSVSVDANGQALLSWSLTSEPDIDKYYILFNDPVLGWSYVDSIDVDNLVLPYTWGGSMAGTRTEQFKIVTIDTCGTQSDELKVVSHNTIYLESSLNKCDGIAEINWNEYVGFQDETGGYDLFVSIDNGGGFGPNILLYAAGPNEFSFTHGNLQKDYQYKYVVQAYDVPELKTASSNQVEITADVPQKSRLLYLAQVSNNLNRGSVDLKAFIDGQADVSGFDIQRSNERNGIYETIGNVAKPVAAPFVVNFSDFSANPKSVYYYRIRSNNLCGGTDSMSNRSNNVVLNIDANSNFTNTLSWNAYENWGGGVGRYDVYRSVNNNQNFTFVGSNDGLDETFIDNIIDFRNENGKFCYYIEAVEDNNPLGFVNDNGEPFKSASNQLCINQGAKVYLPTAFRPGSDVEVNRTFGPTMRFEDVAEYDFYVLNRWGAVMFRTNDPDLFWDGKVDGEVAPTGVYVYYLKYSTLEDVPKEERGTFSLIN